MAAGNIGRRRTIAVWILRGLLGLVFLLVGSSKLTGTGNTVPYFAAIGWGQGSRYLTGLLDVIGAVLLFWPRCTRGGAIVLACSAGSAALIAITRLRGDETWGRPVMCLVPLALALLAALLAGLARSPQPR